MPTIVQPRPAAPPPAGGEGPNVERVLHAYLAQLEDDRPTLVPCALCAGCGACLGTHMVTPLLAAELGSLDEEDDDAPDRA